MSRTEDILEARQQLGDRIRELRKSQSLTQSELAQIVGLDRTRITRLECGSCNITLDTAVVLAQGFGMSISELFAGVGPAPAADTSGETLPITLSLTSPREQYQAVRLD